MIAHAHPYQVDGEVGRFTFTTHALRQGAATRYLTSRWWFPPLQAQEWYRTRGFKELALVHGVVENSYRKTTALINRLRHQEGATPVRTLCDTSEGEGQQLLAQIERQADQLLQAHHFTQEGVPTEAGDWGQASARLADQQVAAALAEGPVPADWKAEREANPVPYEAPATQVYVAIDAVGVKEQKGQRDRKAPPQRGRKHPKQYVHTTVAKVEHDEGSYVLVHAHTVGLLRLLVAFLLHHGLEQQGLVFLLDGQRTLQAAILRAFAWWPSVQLILDWYHLEKKSQELLSLAMKGREQRNATLAELRPLLWQGLTDRAIRYLQQLDPEMIKGEEARQQLIAYLERSKPYLPCYAIRQSLGLPNSSNRAEKANDLVVAQRQKHNGMSWSPEGSLALAALTALIRNQEQDTWFKKNTLTMKFSRAA